MSTPAKTQTQTQTVPDIGKTMAAAYLAVFVVAILAFVANRALTVHIEVRDEFIALAVFYIVAQAVERLVEPLMGTSFAKAEEADNAKTALAAAKNDATQASLLAAGRGADSPASPEAVPAAQQKLDNWKTHRAIIGWAVATCVAMIVCSALGLGLIEAVATVKGAGGWWHGLDVVLTGIAVGGGTKPLHDLIKRIEKSKENADAATGTP